MLIGRDKEKQILQNTLYEEYSQFVAVYGRRRVGKTFLVRETFENRFDFQFTGAANLTARKQLVRFRRVLKEHGQKDTPELTNWGDALARKRNVFQNVTGTKKTIHSIMVTTDDLTRNEYWGDIQAEIQLDDLYEL